MFSRAYHMVTCFPGLVTRLHVFPRLSPGYMFSHAYHSVTCFPALVMFSRAYHRLHVFPRLSTVTCFCFEFWLVHSVIHVCCDWSNPFKILFFSTYSWKFYRLISSKINLTFFPTEQWRTRDQENSTPWNLWWSCDARLFKCVPVFRLKYAMFPTMFSPFSSQNGKKSIPYFRQAGKTYSFWDQIKMFKIYTRFQTKTAKNPYPLACLGRHIPR